MKDTPSATTRSPTSTCRLRLAWRTREELVVTDHVLRAITGHYSSYFRLPYEGNDEESTQETLNGLLRAQQWGYLVVSHDFDTEDWEYALHPHGPNIPLPPLDGRNLTVLMHDGGGSGRQATIDYVARLIPAARKAGYVFQTMPQVQPWMQAATGKITPSVWDRIDLLIVKALYAWPNAALRAMFLYALVAVVGLGVLNAGAGAVATVAGPPSAGRDEAPVSERADRRIQRRGGHPSHRRTNPAFATTPSSKSSSSTTVRTTAPRRSSVSLAAAEPKVRLVSQENHGKWSALNRGLTELTSEIVVTSDADTVFHPDTMTNLVRRFAASESDDLAAVAGVIRVGNRRRNLLTRWQALEYITQMATDRAAQEVLGAILVVPGACAAWRRSAVLAVGGYSHATLAEDADLTLALHEAGYRIEQADDAVADTEAPEDVDALLAQRTRWTYGTLQSIFRHRRMLFRPRYGWLGTVILPGYVLSVLLPIVLLPFVTVMAVLTVINQGWGMLVFYFALFMSREHRRGCGSRAAHA